jgi:hypothetical protein
MNSLSPTFCIAILLLLCGGTLFAIDAPSALGLIHLVLGGTLLFRELFQEGGQSKRLFRTLRVGIVPVVLISCTVFFSLITKNISLDLTEGSKYSLSPGTVRALGSLTKPIEIYQVQIGEVTRLESEKALLERMRSHTPELSIHEVDPVHDIDLIEKLSLSPGDRIALTNGSSSPLRLKEVTEQGVQIALMKLSDQREQRVLYSIGHGEAELQGKGPLGASRLKGVLEQEGVLVEEYSLAQSGSPEDRTALLLIVGPQQPFSEGEEKAIVNFVERGGSLILAAEGNVPVPQVFRREGLSLYPNPIVKVIRQADGQEQFSHDLSIHQYPKHEITTFLTGSASVLLSRAYPIQFTASVSERIKTREEILRFALPKQPESAKPSRPRRPNALTLGVYLEGKNGSRMQLYGDSSWLQNRRIDQAYNTQLLRGAVLWGTRVDAGVAPESSPPQSSVPSVPNDVVQQLIMVFLFAGEGLIFIGAWIAWGRRRRARR